MTMTSAARTPWVAPQLEALDVRNTFGGTFPVGTECDTFETNIVIDGGAPTDFQGDTFVGAAPEVCS